MPEKNVTGKTESVLKKRLMLALMIAAIYIIFDVIGIGCPIKFFTGISCPGCGMTRAVMAALRLNFHDALYYHPLFFLVPFMVSLYFFGDYFKSKFVKYFWAVIIILFLTVYFLRLFIFKNDIVSFDTPGFSVLKLIK